MGYFTGIFFILSLWNPVCILHVQGLSVWTPHTQCSVLCMAGGYPTGQRRPNP